jgi:hypothetical protein
LLLFDGGFTGRVAAKPYTALLALLDHGFPLFHVKRNEKGAW